MLVHQARRLNSPCFIVTNHDSCFLPNFLMTNSDGQKEEVKFDRVLCDVVCSGDATLRKNPDIWLKWNQGQALNLHGVQFRLAKRGAELLAIGGKMVYSTCSLNPVENEAVLHRLIKDSEGALEIVDSASLVPGLKYIPGLTTWDLASKEIECFKSFEDVPEKYHTIIRPQMFPPSPEDASKYNLEKCIRILPHFQNTGGFFVASIVKKSYLPWEKEAKKQEASKSDEQTEQTSTESEKSNSTEPQRKKRRLFHGYKEDPYVFLTPEDLAWSQLKNFYKLSDEFNPLCLLTRSVSEKKKNIYFCSEQIRDLLLCNESSVKIINTGVKTFVRCDNRNMECPFRLANEGLPNINFMIGECRRLNICKDDLIILLNNTDPTKPPPLATLTEETQENVKSLGAGSCVLKYSDDKLTVSLVGWRGQTSLRAYVDTNDTVHILRLLGADLSKYGKFN
ncbi:tRNA (cytosine(34)-C(5))-methyltransferase [Pseudolycoriella hygida]|uniref:tRNA (cytosine(34)-C(5))-methyltransferase n=1 Tax=Pseudolycoriella hygida TaxID=35572 RepID=A0A9Q0S8A4_9DIPT|nr:tRNA (cytosine(34)-C(5))-methyltransferase [Pseudolycoriella hygida]